MNIFRWLFKSISISDKITSILLTVLTVSASKLDPPAILKPGEDPGDEGSDLAHTASLPNKSMN